MSSVVLDNGLKKSYIGVVHAREGREGRYTTEEVLAYYDIRYKGNAREAIRALIVHLLDSLMLQIDAGIAPPLKPCGGLRKNDQSPPYPSRYE